MKLKGEIIQNYIKSYVPLIIKLLIVIPTAITIMNYYLGYQLSTLTKSLITSVNLPSDVWNWIVVLCWLCGLYIAAVTAVFLIILEVLIINFFKCKPLLTIINELIYFDFNKAELKFLKNGQNQSLIISEIIRKLITNKFVDDTEIEIILTSHLLTNELNIYSTIVDQQSIISKLKQIKPIRKDFKDKIYKFASSTTEIKFKPLIYKIIQTTDIQSIRNYAHELMCISLASNHLTTPFETILKYVSTYYLCISVIILGITTSYLINLIPNNQVSFIIQNGPFGALLIITIIGLIFGPLTFIKKFITSLVLIIGLIILVMTYGANFSNIIILNSLKHINLFTKFEEKNSSNNVRLYIDNKLKSKFESSIHTVINVCGESKIEILCIKENNNPNGLNFQLFNFESIYRLQTIESYSHYIYYKDMPPLKFTNQDNYYIEESKI